MGKYMPWVLGAIGAVLAFRAIYRPHRALIASGNVLRCPGPDPKNPIYGTCDVTLTVEQSGGKPDDVFSVVRGDVISIGPDWVHIQPENEPVVLYYGGVDPSVEMGASVGRGQVIGQAATFSFGVWEMKPGGKIVAVEPASWLAARGLRIASSLDEVDLWCEQGRKISVPKSSHQPCLLELPTEAGFALLPVSVKEE